MEGTGLDALLADVVETTAQPYLVLTDGYRVEFANRAFYDCFRMRAEETAGVSLFALGQGQWDVPELRTLLEDILPTRREVTGFRLEHDFAAIGRRIMVVNARRIPDSRGRADMILLAISDVTEREREKNELIAASEFNEKLIDSIREMVLVLTPDFKVELANLPFHRCFQTSAQEVEERSLFEVGNGAWDIPELRELLETILPERETFDDLLIERDFERIGRRVMSLNARRMDQLPRILLAIRDLTEARAHEARQNTMVAELQHRVNNVLANVNALARLTHERSASLQEFRRAFDGRLFAMARTQDLLARGAEASADLGELARGTLDVAGAHEGLNFTLRGPVITLTMREAEVLGLVLHELATNASRHGALAGPAPGAAIDIEWSVGGADDGDMTLSWRERGVAIPERPAIGGFGTMILEESAPYMLGGTAAFALSPGGIEYTLSFRRRHA